MSTFQTFPDDPPQLPPCCTCGRDTWHPGERWYFIRGQFHVEPYCQECVPPWAVTLAAFVQNGEAAARPGA